MDPVGILVTCLIGGICGWLAGQILKGRGFGLAGNIIVGIVGAALFGVIARTLQISIGGELVGQIIGGTIGSVLLLMIIGFVKKNA